MYITIFIKASPSSGGLETQNELLAKGLENRGHNVEVIETAAPFGDLQDPDPKTDIVISQSAAGTKYLMRKGKDDPPVVVIQHGTLFGSLKTRSAMTPQSKRVTTLLRLLPYAVKAYILDQLRLRKAAAVIAVSNQVADALAGEYLLPRSKIAVVYNGIEVDKFDTRNSVRDTREQLGLPVGDAIIIYIGRIAKEKGLMLLLKAVTNLKSQIPASPAGRTNLKIIFVGDGNYRSELETYVEEQNLQDYVSFIGKVPYEKVPQYYNAADLFVLPSTAWEGLPMSIIEAMASGLPVVASNIGGIPNAVIDGKTGKLVVPGSVDDVASSLQLLLKDDDLRARISKEARASAEEKFSVNSMVEETIRVMRNALRGSSL